PVVHGPLRSLQRRHLARSAGRYGRGIVTPLRGHLSSVDRRDGDRHAGKYRGADPPESFRARAPGLVTMAAAILDVRGLRKSFGTHEVLRGIDLAAPRQELVFMTGPSGSGKSTFLRCLNRLEEPTSGAIVVDGVDMIAPKTNLNAMRRRIGMVFQSFNLYP